MGTARTIIFLYIFITSLHFVEQYILLNSNYNNMNRPDGVVGYHVSLTFTCSDKVLGSSPSLVSHFFFTFAALPNLLNGGEIGCCSNFSRLETRRPLARRAREAMRYSKQASLYLSSANCRRSEWTTFLERVAFSNSGFLVDFHADLSGSPGRR